MSKEGTRMGSRIAVIGIGGTGCALVPLLATLQLEQLTLIDGDTVEQANLARQPLFGPADVGRMKVDAAADRITRQAPHLPVVRLKEFASAANIDTLIAQHDIIADCTDDLNARALIDRTCAKHHVPLVTGAVHGTQVQVITLHADDRSLSLRSFFPGKSNSEQDGCDMRSVPPSVTALAAAVMYDRIAALLGNDRSACGSMDLIDTTTGGWMRLKAPEPEPQGEPIADHSSNRRA